MIWLPSTSYCLFFVCLFVCYLFVCLFVCFFVFFAFLILRKLESSYTVKKIYKKIDHILFHHIKYFSLLVMSICYAVFFFCDSKLSSTHCASLDVTMLSKNNIHKAICIVQTCFPDRNHFCIGENVVNWQENKSEKQVECINFFEVYCARTFLNWI